MAVSKLPGQVREYARDECIVFCKTKEAYGSLSNMASGYPLCVNGVNIRTSEALYQACRFPHIPDLQRQIIDQASPMVAKLKAKPSRQDSRSDWDQVRVKIMRWCLRVKLAQNWDSFGKLLASTGNRPIVELSRKDAFWGAKLADKNTLIGVNALGRLLMELRELMSIETIDCLMYVKPLDISNFALFDKPIESLGSPPSIPESQCSSPLRTKDDLICDEKITESLDLNHCSSLEQSNIKDRFYALFLESAKDLTKDEPASIKALAQATGLQKPQVKAWLKQACEEEFIKRLSKPVRFIWNSPDSVQVPMFVKELIHKK